jgi:hypothetical protein
MIVPTLTMLGRSWCPWSREAGIVVEAVATGAIMSRPPHAGHPDPLSMDDIFSLRWLEAREATLAAEADR